jgi:hypothetical protein
MEIQPVTKTPNPEWAKWLTVVVFLFLLFTCIFGAIDTLLHLQID